MNLPDRSKWPEGATHWSPADAVMRLEAYWRPNGYGAFDCWALTSEPRFWQKNYATLPDCAVELPADWNGKGLPPAGAVCEIREKSCQYFSPAAIKFASRNVVVWDWQAEPALNGLCTAYSHNIEIRPIRTAEQIAAEKLEVDAADLAEVMTGHRDRSGDCYLTLAKVILEAGYRKQVAP